MITNSLRSRLQLAEKGIEIRLQISHLCTTIQTPSCRERVVASLGVLRGNKSPRVSSESIPHGHFP